jgi:hypothetical protein
VLFLLEQHPKIASRHSGEVGVADSQPRTPTPARPGSLEKVLVLAERAARREYLWHSADATQEVTEVKECCNGERLPTLFRSAV